MFLWRAGQFRPGPGSDTTVIDTTVIDTTVIDTTAITDGTGSGEPGSRGTGPDELPSD